MEEELIKFDTAKLAKEEGCEIELFTDDYEYENEYGETVVCNYDPTNRLDEEKFNVRRVVLCTQSLLQKWLRDTHSIHVEVQSYHSLGVDNPYSVTIEYVLPGSGDWWYFEFERESDFNTYEEALEEGLRESLSLIKN